MKLSNLLLFCLLAPAITINAQSLSLSDSTGQLPHGSFKTVAGQPGDDLLTTYAFVTNNSSSTLNVKVKKIENYITPNSVNLFCWGLCFPPNIYVSPDPIPIGPGETNQFDFHGEYFPTMTTGTTSVTYVFFDEANPNDSVAFHALYKTEGLPSITEITPDSAATGQTVSVSVTGANTHFTFGTEVMLKNDMEEIMASGVNASGDLNLTAEFQIPQNATNGLWDLVAVNILDGHVVTENAFQIYTVSGIAGEMEDRIRIYPNPASDILYLDLCNNYNGRFDIILTDALGQHLMKFKSGQINNQVKIDVTTYETGTYFLILDGDGSREVHKVMLSR